MRAADALSAMQNFDFSELDDVLGDGGLLVIAPHQDDESLACGGLIAEACAQGRAVRVVFVSDGTGSHPRSRAFPRTRLRQVREAEARAAVSALGLAPRHVDFLRLPDRFVPSTGPAANAAIDHIVDAATRIGASAMFVSWRHDPHCDHQAAYRLARAAQQRLALRLYEYSVWGAALEANTPVTPVTSGFRLRTAQRQKQKLRAIEAHRSQTSALISDDPKGFRLSASDIKRFAKPYETFVGSPE